MLLFTREHNDNVLMLMGLTAGSRVLRGGGGGVSKVKRKRDLHDTSCRVKRSMNNSLTIEDK